MNVGVSIPNFGELSVNANINEANIADISITSPDSQMSNTSTVRQSQYGGFTSTEVEEMDFNSETATIDSPVNVNTETPSINMDTPKSGEFSSQTGQIGSTEGIISENGKVGSGINPNSPQGVNTTPRMQSGDIESQTREVNPNSMPDQAGNNGGLNLTNPSQTSTTSPNAPRMESPTGQVGSSTMSPQSQTGLTPGQTGEQGGMEIGSGPVGSAENTQTPAVTVETSDSNMKLTITQMDENNNPIEVEITVGELIESFRSMGLCDADINRLLSGEITLPELIEEILADPERKRLLYEAAFLDQLRNIDDASMALRGDVYSLNQLQDVIDQYIEKRDEIAQEIRDTYWKEIEYEVLREVIILLLNGADINDILESAYGQYKAIVYVYYDDQGDMYYVWNGSYDGCIDESNDIGGFDRRTHLLKPEDIAISTGPGDQQGLGFIAYIPYAEILMDSEYYDDIVALASSRTETKKDIWGKTYTVTVPCIADTPEANAFLSSFYAEYNAFSEHKVNLNKDYVDINDEIFKLKQISQFVNNYLDYHLTCIEPYIYNEDFAANCQFDMSNLTFVDEMVEDFIESNDKVGNLTGNHEAIVKIIACILYERTNDGESIFLSESGDVIVNGPLGLIAIITDDNMIADFFQYSDYFLEEEKNVFNYLVNSCDYEAAYQWLLDIYDEMDNRAVAAKTQEDQEYARNHPGLVVLHSIFVGPFESLDALVYSNRMVRDGFKIRSINTYVAADVMTETRASDIAINKATNIVKINGYSSLEEARVMNPDVYHGALDWGESMANLYNISLSMGSSVVLVAITLPFGGQGIIPAIGRLTLTFVMMGTRAYASTLNDALARGMSDFDAVRLAWAYGIAETAMEYISLGNLLHIGEKLGGTVLAMSLGIPSKAGRIAFTAISLAISQALVEAEEEFATEILNTISEYFIAGDLSDFNLNFEHYLELGYSEENAMELAFRDKKKQISAAALGGFLSGLTLGIFGSSFKLHKIHYQMGMSLINQYESNGISLSKMEALQLVGVEDVLRELSNLNVEQKQIEEFKKSMFSAKMGLAFDILKSIIKSSISPSSNAADIDVPDVATQQTNNGRFNTPNGNIRYDGTLRTNIGNIVSTLEVKTELTSDEQTLASRFNSLSQDRLQALDALSGYYLTVKENIKAGKSISLDGFILVQFLDKVLSPSFNMQAKYLSVLLDENFYDFTSKGLEVKWNMVPNGGKNISIQDSIKLYENSKTGEVINGITIERINDHNVTLDICSLEDLDKARRVYIWGGENADGTLQQGTIYIERLHVGQKLAVLSLDNGYSPGKYYVDLAQFGDDAIENGKLRPGLAEEIRQKVAVDLAKETLSEVLVIEIKEINADNLIAIYSQNAPAFASPGGIVQMQIVPAVKDGRIKIDYKQALDKKANEYLSGNWQESNTMSIEDLIAAGVVLSDFIIDNRVVKNFSYQLFKETQHQIEVLTGQGKSVGDIAAQVFSQAKFLESVGINVDEILATNSEKGVKIKIHIDDIISIYNETGKTRTEDILSVFRTSNTNDSSTDAGLPFGHNSNPPRVARFSLFSKVTTIGLNAFFARFNQIGKNYGAAQGFLQQQFFEDKTRGIKIGTDEYFRLKNKLISIGFSPRSASMIMSGLDRVGACSYAAIANGIFNAFKNNQARFEQIFGYKMTVGVNGQTILNTGELLLDLYTFINDESNGGKLFRTNSDGSRTILEIDLNNKDMFGRTLLDAEGQTYLSGFRGLNEAVISKFLKSKDSGLSIDFSLIARFEANQVVDNAQMQAIVNCVVQALNAGRNVHLGIYSKGSEIRLLGLDSRTPNFSTHTWNEGAGHAVFITEVQANGFVVSSWGYRLLIPFEDLQNGGQFAITEWNVNNITKTMTEAEIQISNDILYAFNEQFKKYGPLAADYIWKFLNGNINAITRNGNARFILQKYTHEQIMYVVNNFINIEMILNSMSNNTYKNYEMSEFEGDRVNNFVQNPPSIKQFTYEEAQTNISSMRNIDTQTRIETRRLAHENANKQNVTKEFRLRVLTDLDIIRSRVNVDLAFEDLRRIYGNLPNEELVNYACHMENYLLTMSKHKTIHFMNMTMNIYGDGPKIKITEARVKKYISQLPVGMRMQLKEVNIFNDRCPYDIYWEVARSWGEEFWSAATGGNVTINIWNGQIGLGYYGEMGPIIHETGHGIDTFLGNGRYWTEENSTWSNAMWQDNQTLSNFYISKYASESQDIREDFADSFMEYLRNPTEFSILAPYRSAIISNIITNLEMNYSSRNIRFSNFSPNIVPDIINID